MAKRTPSTKVDDAPLPATPKRKPRAHDAIMVHPLAPDPRQTALSPPWRGRPTAYTEEKAQLVLELLSNGWTLNRICREHDHLPDPATIRNWVMEDREGFSPRYTRARRLCADYWADETIDIADDRSHDFITTTRTDADGEVIATELTPNHVGAARSAQMVAQRNLLMSQIVPAVYGRSLKLTGDAENPIAMLLGSFKQSTLPVSGAESDAPAPAPAALPMAGSVGLDDSDD